MVSIFWKMYIDLGHYEVRQPKLPDFFAWNMIRKGDRMCAGKTPTQGCTCDRICWGETP